MRTVKPAAKTGVQISLTIEVMLVGGNVPQNHGLVTKLFILIIVHVLLFHVQDHA